MLSNKIEGWRVIIAGRSRSTELIILGPGKLRIIIPDFSVEKLIYESIATVKNGSVMGIIDCTYPLFQGERELKLSFNYINEPPDAFLMGSDFWALPMEFAEQLIHIFLLGVPHHSKHT